MQALDQILQQEIHIDKALIKMLISFIDLTTLNNTDTESTVKQLIAIANAGHEGVHPAALCTFSGFGAFAKANLKPTINTAVVGGCFPTGQTLSKAKVEECRLIAETGVDEIDIVLNRGDFFAGNYTVVLNEISAIKKAIGTVHLKVILETGDFDNTDDIKKAAELAIEAGADFIKTSTGKTSQGASEDAVYTMCLVIKEHYQKTKKKIGIKPSGGIRTLDDALIYYKIVNEILGSDWLSPELFRIGASSLYKNLIDALDNY